MPFNLAALVKDKPKSAQELALKAFQAFQELETAKKEKQTEKAIEHVSNYLRVVAFWLFGDDEHEPNRENVLSLVSEICRTELLVQIVKHLRDLDFETRKDATKIFGAVLRFKDDASGAQSIGAAYISKRHGIMDRLFQGYEDPNIALNCGSMLRDCIRDEQLCKDMLDSDCFMKFFEKVEVQNFEIASDAFATFKDVLTRHKAMIGQYLSDHYTEFFGAYMNLLRSQNYVTRRQSLKLLGELLMDRNNVLVMVRFVSEAPHLMQMMMLLKDPSRTIQFEAFHVFKVFVANPNKPQQVVDILVNNKEKLLNYLENFHTEKDEDEQFKEEKAVIIREISQLGQQPAAGMPAPDQ